MSKRIGNYVGFSTFLEGGGGNKGIWNLIDQFYFSGKGEWQETSASGISSATGGTVTTYDSYRVHTFTSSGTFTVVSGAGNVEYLVVAGGGGGGQGTGSNEGQGGGGAGGLRIHSPLSPIPINGSAVPVSPGPYTIIVGGGGGTNTPNLTGTNGSPSSFGPLDATGGGGGGGLGSPPPQRAGNPGGSGGGGVGAYAISESPSFGLGNSPPTSPSQGNPGGSQPQIGGGGGGGISSPGGTSGGIGPGPGGTGLSLAFSSASPVTYSQGGSGGGGLPGPVNGSPGGGSNTGGGGGGSGAQTTGATGGSPGIVIIRYLT